MTAPRPAWNGRAGIGRGLVVHATSLLWCGDFVVQVTACGREVTGQSFPVGTAPTCPRCAGVVAGRRTPKQVTARSVPLLLRPAAGFPEADAAA
jgi:hypothetical protein